MHTAMSRFVFKKFGFTVVNSPELKYLPKPDRKFCLAFWNINGGRSYVPDPELLVHEIIHYLTCSKDERKKVNFGLIDDHPKSIREEERVLVIEDYVFQLTNLDGKEAWFDKDSLLCGGALPINVAFFKKQERFATLQEETLEYICKEHGFTIDDIKELAECLEKDFLEVL